MSFSDKDNIDRILVGTDYTKMDEVSVQSGPTPELLGAVVSLTHDPMSAEGITP